MLCQCGELSSSQSAFFPCSLIPAHLFVPRFVHSNWNDDFQVSESEILKRRTPQSSTALREATLAWRELSSPTRCTISPKFLVFLGNMLYFHRAASPCIHSWTPACLCSTPCEWPTKNGRISFSLALDSKNVQLGTTVDGGLLFSHPMVSTTWAL